MKKSILVLGIATLLLASCGDSKKKEIKKEVDTKVEKVQKPVTKSQESGADSKIADGKKLFTDKGCVACHQEAIKVVGPSLKDIAAKYNETNGNMVQFLKGEGTAIVDTDPAQVAVMQANFAVTKTLTDEQLTAISAYISSVK
jgi:cytochrome c